MDFRSREAVSCEAGMDAEVLEGRDEESLS